MRSIIKTYSSVCLALVMVSLAACTNVKKVDYLPILDHPEDAHPAPIKFTKLKTKLPVGMEMGVYRHRCLLSFSDVGRNYLKGNINQPLINDSFVEALDAQGYDLVSHLNVSFVEEAEAEDLRSEYKVSAKIIDAQIDVCETPDFSFNLLNIDPLFLGKGGFKGKLFLKIEWGVWDNLHRKTVYKTTTEGYVHSKNSNMEGVTLMVNEAFAMAAHNLGAQKEFHDLIFYGTKPPQDWNRKKKRESRPRVFDPQERVVISNPPLSEVILTDHIERTQKAAVMVQAGSGHGSGYFISSEGHILTNAHVVGDAMRVRIVTAGRKDKLIAEVLRKNTPRDVALLKLEEIPHGMKIVTLPIKVEWPKVSSDIYALGAPQKTRLQDTVSKGIVSAHRKGYKIFGTKMDFIQGDVSIHGGNSGGPLLDGYGNLIGMSVAGYSYNDYNANDSLNLFIPIADALKYMNIILE
ncbi:MAG: S1C family serine protease [Alphaproteobacteria bacterium]